MHVIYTRCTRFGCVPPGNGEESKRHAYFDPLRGRPARPNTPGDPPLVYLIKFNCTPHESYIEQNECNLPERGAPFLRYIVRHRVLRFRDLALSKLFDLFRSRSVVARLFFYAIFDDVGVSLRKERERERGEDEKTRDRYLPSNFFRGHPVCERLSLLLHPPPLSLPLCNALMYYIMCRILLYMAS